jgi:hypothetical protein
MKIWTYRRPFWVQGCAFTVLIVSGFTGWRSRLMLGPQELAVDETVLMGAALDFRNHKLSHTLPDGSKLDVEVGYLNWFNTGIRGIYQQRAGVRKPSGTRYPLSPLYAQGNSGQPK